MAGGADGRLELDIVTHTTRKEKDGTKKRYTNTVAVKADEDPTVEVAGKTRQRERVDASDRGARLFLYNLDRAMVRTAYRESPPRPAPKPMSGKPKGVKQPKDDDIVACPKCAGQLDNCVFCGGDRYMTYRQAREIERPAED